MKKLLLLCTAVLFSFGMDALAQSDVAAPGKTDVQSEIRTTSGELKETYGAVQMQLTALNKEIAAGTEATAEQKARKEKLSTALSQIEGMLTTVNTANEEAWPEIKAKAQMVRGSAMELVPQAK